MGKLAEIAIRFLVEQIGPAIERVLEILAHHGAVSLVQQILQGQSRSTLMWIGGGFFLTVAVLAWVPCPRLARQFTEWRARAGARR